MYDEDSERLFAPPRKEQFAWWNLLPIYPLFLGVGLLELWMVLLGLEFVAGLVGFDGFAARVDYVSPLVMRIAWAIALLLMIPWLAATQMRIVNSESRVARWSLFTIIGVGYGFCIWQIGAKALWSVPS